MAADVPKIVLTPLERSHHFGRRECVATEVLKVGRSVDRRRISPNNLIFDCRVLSRNHAQIWFENGKFFIKDTKSSNGTFVNENRLSPSGEESGPVELKSRDIVQFGVNVNVDKKVTHGCIIATVKLYLNEVEVPGHEPPVQQVLHIIQSALVREQELENKLASMQGVLNVAKDLASESMIAIVKEDELMSRLEMMESQLQIYSRNATEDELKKKLKEAYEEKRTGDLSAKDKIRNILQEKLESLSKLNELQRDYDRAEQECQKYKMLYDSAKQEHTQEVSKLGTELTKAESERKTIQEKMTEEKQSLIANLESVQAEVDFTKEQLDMAKSRLSDTQTELVDLKMKAETERQRDKKKLDMEESTEDPLSATLLPGTDDPTVTLQTSVPPLKELADQYKIQGKGLAEEHAPDTTISTSALQRLSPLAHASPAHLTDDQRRTLMPASRNSAEISGRLEAELKASRARIRDLENQLLSAAEGGGGVTSSAGSAVRFGSLESSPDDSVGQIAGEEPTEMELARNLSAVVIAKSQILLLQEYLAESQARVKKLEDNMKVLEPLLDGSTKIKLHTAEDLATLLDKLQRTESECDRLSAENRALREELRSVRMQLEEERRKNEELQAENLVLRAENKALRQRLDEVSAVQEPSLAAAHQQQQQQQHVKILTILALVSIGVALASWLM